MKTLQRKLFLLITFLPWIANGAFDGASYGKPGEFAALLSDTVKKALQSNHSSYGKKKLMGEAEAEEYYGFLKEKRADQLGVLPGHEKAHAIDMYAEKKVYDNICKNVEATQPTLSLEEQQEYANKVYADWKKLPEDPAYIKYTSEYALYRAQKNVSENPTSLNKLILFVQNNFLQPWSRFNAEHATEINAAAKFLVMASAAAFIFNKIGGTEYVRKKISAAFDRPKVYTVRRHGRNWFFNKKPRHLIGESDLILSPRTGKQVRELIFLIKRRYEMSKISTRKFTFPHVLLYGPPGTGKTSIAQMIADQTIGDNGKPMNFIRLMASDFMQIKREGDRIAVLKEMFDEARKMKNTIIFLDEVDSMTRQRGKDNDGPNRGFLDHLLDELATPSSDFMVIAATNHVGDVDDAFLSRMQRKLKVDLPTLSMRKLILDKKIEQELLQKGYQSQLDTAALSAIMAGDSGRDLESFVMRLRDRLDFEQLSQTDSETAYSILREMGKIPSAKTDEESD